MGAYSPTYYSNTNIISDTEILVIKPILKAMRDKGHPYRGFLYVGIMIVNGDPYGKGWFIKLRVTDPSSIHQLMDELTYNSFVESVT